MKTKNSEVKNNQVLLFEEMNWKQIEALDKEKTVLFLPMSPLEEHGPHLPVGTDLITARDASREAIKILQQKKTGSYVYPFTSCASWL